MVALVLKTLLLTLIVSVLRGSHVAPGFVIGCPCGYGQDLTLTSTYRYHVLTAAMKLQYTCIATMAPTLSR